MFNQCRLDEGHGGLLSDEDFTKVASYEYYMCKSLSTRLLASLLLAGFEEPLKHSSTYWASLEINVRRTNKLSMHEIIILCSRYVHVFSLVKVDTILCHWILR